MKAIDPKTIGRKIKKIRLMLGYKQEYMALKIGLSQTGFSKIETGETNMTLERASAVAKVFEMTLIDLIEWEEQIAVTN